MCQAGDKRVEIIPLAQKKMAQRGIPTLWVEEALANPDQVIEGYAGRPGGHKHVAMEGKERLLRIVYEETASTLVVVTAYLTSDIARYWRDTP